MSAAIQIELPVYVPIRGIVVGEDGQRRLAIVAQTTVDAPDFDVVMAAGPWHVNGDGYARSHRAGSLQRFLLQPPDTHIVDHINGNRLDNRRANLRVCTLADNARNRTRSWGVSEYLGVRLEKRSEAETGRQVRGWAARIIHNHRGYDLGCFTSEKTAALAYDHAARILFGEFASPNFPHETAPLELALRVERKIAGLCILCGSNEHKANACPTVAGERRECCGRLKSEPHTIECRNRIGRRCKACGGRGHYAKTCGRRTPDRTGNVSSR